MGLLNGLRVVVDVQHLYRTSHPNDRGSVFTLGNGTHISEGEAALVYADGLADWLTDRGAEVLTNQPGRGILTGYYSTRNRAAAAFAAHVYLACHLNAGGGRYALAEFMSTTIGEALALELGPPLTTRFPQIRSAQTRGLRSDDRGAVCIERVAGSIAAVLCEPFFGDNPEHQGLLATPQLRAVGEAIGFGVSNWWAKRRP